MCFILLVDEGNFLKVHGVQNLYKPVDFMTGVGSLFAASSIDMDGNCIIKYGLQGRALVYFPVSLSRPDLVM